MTDQLRIGMDDDPTASTERDRERAEYLERLREHLKDSEFRAIEGFPIGEDEDILALSDPPYYTACPNPFLPEIIARWQREREEIRKSLGLPVGEAEEYHREPYAADVREGKNDPIYNAHSYHTKVPHKAIMRHILHYTDPGDVVLDGFCGTGMTGVAAQLCGDHAEVEALGYRVDADGVIYEGEQAITHLGTRKSLLSDLSPMATFIAYNYNTTVDAEAFEREARRIVQEVHQECGWMYETWHPSCTDSGRVKGTIQFIVYSDVFICSQCGEDLVFWQAAVDADSGRIRESIACRRCGAMHRKSQLEHAFDIVFDEFLGESIRMARSVPVLINYTVGGKRYEKVPDTADLALQERVAHATVPQWVPSVRMPEGSESRRNDGSGITHVHHFFTRANLRVIAAILARVAAVQEPRVRAALTLVTTAVIPYASKMRRFRADRKGGGPLSGTLYISSLITPPNVLLSFQRNVTFVQRGLAHLRARHPSALIECRSATALSPRISSSIDYIFTDPPFGGNLMYAELNFLWEAWLKVSTDSTPEAVENPSQGKMLVDYQRLMTQCFRKYYLALKPGHWITVEFHNSRNSVWNSIQESLQTAGFVIADVGSLDKQQGSFKQIMSTGAVKQDLIISAYRPSSDLEERFEQDAGTEDSSWDFVRSHLRQLVSPIAADGTVDVTAERRDYLLYDRMVAYHLTRGATVPLSAADFYAGLRQRFVERDGMFFLPEQVVEYDRAKMAGAKVQQLTLFVQDEKSAIQWLRQRLDPALGGAPQTYQDIQPAFLQDLHQARHEALPEMHEVLEENFLQDERGRWYVPDPARAGDLEKVRVRGLLREFDEYLKAKGRLRQCRMEAVRAGFARAWQDRDYQTIVRVAERLPRRALEEDPNLLMYYDNATLMVE